MMKHKTRHLDANLAKETTESFDMDFWPYRPDDRQAYILPQAHQGILKVFHF